MCGLASAINESSRVVAQMLERIQHRGPDGQGIKHHGAAVPGKRTRSKAAAACQTPWPVKWPIQSFFTTPNSARRLATSLKTDGHTLKLDF